MGTIPCRQLVCMHWHTCHWPCMTVYKACIMIIIILLLLQLQWITDLDRLGVNNKTIQYKGWVHWRLDSWVQINEPTCIPPVTSLHVFIILLRHTESIQMSDLTSFKMAWEVYSSPLAASPFSPFSFLHLF